MLARGVGVHRCSLPLGRNVVFSCGEGGMFDDSLTLGLERAAVER
nr:MAG TPA: hypothetical protein [Caudoviricetes sp.]